MERPVFVVCHKCGGEGVVSTQTYCSDYPCDECSGTGAVEDEARLITLDDLEEMDSEEQASS